MRGAENHAVDILLDGIGGANHGASGILAVHANYRRGLYARAAINVIEVDHRYAAVRVAFSTRCHAGLAANATRGIDKKLQIIKWQFRLINWCYHQEAFSTLHAHTLNSGIFEIGSRARLVIWLAAFLPGQW